MPRRVLLPLLAAAAAVASAGMPALANAQVFGGVDRDEPLARFQDPLCPGVIGIPLDRAQDIVALIRDNARMLGLRLGDPRSCDPNVIVAVMNDPQAFLKNMVKRHPYLLQDMDQGERERLLEGSGPVRNWTHIEVRTRDGLMVPRRLSLDQVPLTTQQMAHSKIYKATRRDITSAMVLIEPSAVQGLTVTQLADYATMRALSDDAADKLHAPRATILHLFDAGAEKPAELTASDWTFLRTLYSTEPNDPASITLAMADDRIAKGR